MAQEYPKLYSSPGDWDKSIKCENSQEADKPLDQGFIHAKRGTAQPTL